MEKTFKGGDVMDDDQLKEILKQAVYETGVTATPVQFKESIPGGGSGSMITRVVDQRPMYEIWFCISRLRFEFTHWSRQAIQLGNIEEFAKMIAHHEAFHLMDEKKSSRASIAKKYYWKALVSTMRMNKAKLREYYKLYAKVNYQFEVRAWEYAKTYVPEPLIHGFTQYAKACLASYEKLYRLEFKNLLYILEINSRLTQEVSDEFCDLHYMSREYQESSLIEENKLMVSIPYLLRKKPLRLKMKSKDYLFYQVLYEYASQGSSKEEIELVEYWAMDYSTYGDFDEAERAVDYYESLSLESEQRVFATIETWLLKQDYAYENFKIFYLEEVKRSANETRRYINSDRRRSMRIA